MKTAKKKGFRVMSVFMCFLILISGILVIMGSIRSNQVAAANEITFYFDSSCLGKNSDWVDKNPEYVYYYAYKSTNNTGIKRMEPVSGKTGSDGGKLYKGTVDKDQYSYLIILKNNNWSDKKYQTLDYSLNNVKDKDILILNTSGYNVGNNNEYVQGMYVKGTFEETTNYSSQKFSILNMDDQEVTLQIKYSTRTKKYENGQWTSWNSTEGVEYSTSKEYTIPARHYQYKQFEVPARESGKEPWQSVHICTSNGTEIKKYYFPEGKILGKSFFYGITDFHSTQALSYGDGTKLCYITSDLGSLNSTSYELYFDKNFFTSAPKYAIGTNLSSYSPATALTKDGNAKYVTDGNVSLNSWERQDNTAVDINLSSQIMSVEYNGVQYNLFAPQNAGDNHVKVNDNVAVISGKYTVQSTGNVSADGTNYITVKSDFYDYQYDKYDYNVNVVGNYDGYKTNLKGSAKRPYQFINEALSESGYGSTSYPLYLGQFWLPLDDGDANHDTSGEAYTSTTAPLQRSGYNDKGDKYWIKNEQPDNEVFKQRFGFGRKLNNFHWASNLAFRESSQPAGDYKPYDAVVQGLVADTLSADKNLMAPGGTVEIPYFYENWWSGSFTAQSTDGENKSQSETDDKSNYIDKYKELPFPFFETPAANISYKDGYSSDYMLSDHNDQYEGTYYVFDSRKHVIQVDNSGLEIKSSKGEHLVYDNYGKGISSNNSEVGFFPFNSDADNNSSNLHYGFGVTFAIDFFLNENGTLDGTPDGTPISFTFQGDDDVWVFLDDKLILDMGGAHKNAIGEINFRAQTTFIGAVSTINSTNQDDVTVGRNDIQPQVKSFSNIGSQYLTTGRHKITMYYLERGMLNSNLYVMFNLPLELTKYDLQTDTDFTGINTGFKAATKKVAENDVFNYQIQNKGTTNVVGSDYKLPTYDYINRTNSETGQTTNLSGQPEQTNTITPTQKIYFEPNSGWQEANAKFAAWMWNSDDSKKKYAPVKWDSDVNKWYVDYDSKYTEGILWLRLDPDKYYDQEVDNANWDDIGLTGAKWTQTENYTGSDFPSSSASNSNITFRVSGTKFYSTTGDFTTTPVSYTVTVYDTHNFQGSSGSYQPMISLVENVEHGVTYQLTEPDFGGGGVTTFDTRSVTSGSTTAKGVVSMQYGEMATFSKQLEGGSQMKVKLLDTLSAPVSGSRANSYYDSTGRKASDYYVTHYKQDELASNGYRRYAGIYRGDDVAAIALKHVDQMYDRTVNDSAKNYSTNHVINPQVEDGALEFVFADPKNAADGYVYLRQVVVNEVKTVKLKISKDILANEPCNDTFTFKIVFSNIFGDSTGDSDIDYDQIAYKKYNSNAPNTPIETGKLDDDGGNDDGSFSLTKGQYIEIENIPVMTKYYLTETSTPTNFTLSDEYSVNMGSINNKVVNKVVMNGDMSAVVTNKRTTGTIQVQKLVYDESGDLMNGDGSLTTEFTLMIGLKAPNDVNLDNYPIKFMQNGTDLVATSKAVKLEGSALTPYTSDYPAGDNGDNWAVYNVTVKANTAADGAYRLNIQNVPSGTEYKVHERSVPLGFVIPKTKPTNSVWNQSAYNCNTSGTYANVMYKDSAKTLNNTDDDLVTVENNLNPIEMPSTGGSGVVLIFPLGILAIVLSGAAVMIYKRKIDNGSILRKGRYMK